MHHSGSHDPVLVALSVLIAIVSSYTALDLFARARSLSGPSRRPWLFAAAMAMGGGIWAMHFVAMLAFSVTGMAVPVRPRTDSVVLRSADRPSPASRSVWSSKKRVSRCRSRQAGLSWGWHRRHALHGHGRDADGGQPPLRRVLGRDLDCGRRRLRDRGPLDRVTGHTRGLETERRHPDGSRDRRNALLRNAGTDVLPGGKLEPAPAHGDPGMDLTGVAGWVACVTLLILLLAIAAAAFDRRLGARSALEAAKLRASEERFRLLLKSITDYAVFMLDPDGNVTNWNTGAERIKGYTAEEIVGHHFSHFYTPEDREAGLPARALAMADEEGHFEHEGWRLRKDGSRFWASVVIDPIRDDAGKLIGFVKITRDITERKRAQEALEQAREALFQAQKMEALGQLTGGVAHDFNNLLMAVLGSLELLRKRLPDDPRSHRLLDNAAAGAKRGAALTQRMLAFARKQELSLAPVDVAALVRGMTGLFERTVGPHVRIETLFSDRLPRAIADANQAELALLNLVVNARDAMPEGGKVTIGVQANAGQSPPGLAPGAYVCLSVEDTGDGHGRRDTGESPGTLLHDEGRGKGHGPRPSHGQGCRRTVRRRASFGQRAGTGHAGRSLVARRRFSGRQLAA